ncbi:tribbles homolog 2 [Anguilla anguilla]|uniref:tribbles homolog 2 n=1 Tax=Anguilla anguilla TaxID=7936 RepID=UPI0015B2DCAE|nr:tribbles homolog 2 [Anguilla anguilla]
MNIQRSTPINITRYGRSRHKAHDFEELSCLRTTESVQSFSPNLGSPSPPETPNSSHCISCIGKYLLLEPLEGDHVFRAAHLHSGAELVCKVFDITRYQESLAAYFCLSAHRNINQIAEILLGDTKAYVFFERSHGDMHSFVRACKKLREDEAARLFHQIASAVAHCHDNSLVLRDLKLRKFVFKNEDRSLVMLESLEDACVLRGEDDSLSDKHGCPAYVSPEVLSGGGSYSGRAADVWSLGVMLYTMLVGRYPFHDLEPGSLFSKIRRGHFSLPESLSPKARCLIRSVLRRDPAQRLTAREVLDHPWLASSLDAPPQPGPAYGRGGADRGSWDQLVPDVNMQEDLDKFFS